MERNNTATEKGTEMETWTKTEIQDAIMDIKALIREEIKSGHTDAVLVKAGLAVAKKTTTLEIVKPLVARKKQFEAMLAKVEAAEKN